MVSPETFSKLKTAEDTPIQAHPSTVSLRDKTGDFMEEETISNANVIDYMSIDVCFLS